MSILKRLGCTKCTSLRFKLDKAFPDLVDRVICKQDGNPCSRWKEPIKNKKEKCDHHYESHLDKKDNTMYYECTRCGDQQRYDDN